MYNLKKVGKESQHLHFQVQSKQRKFPVIAFKLGEHEAFIRNHQKIDLVCHIQKNEWQGNVQTQLRCVDVG